MVLHVVHCTDPMAIFANRVLETLNKVDIIRLLINLFVYFLTGHFRVTCCCYIGAPWIKLNQDEVCFGAKNDSYGNFTITSDGTIIALKLVYISGFVTCNKVNQPYGSHWACQKGSKIAIIVTNTKKEVMFPQNYQNQAYVLPGYHENSSELVFSRLSPPLALRVAAGEEYWVWYHEDFMDKSEYNNGGHTCVDVYAL